MNQFASHQLATALYRRAGTVFLQLALAAFILIALSDWAKAQLTNTQIAQTFFKAYSQALLNPGAISDLQDLLIPDELAGEAQHHGGFQNVELTYAGAPGEELPYAGTWVGRDGVRRALSALARTSRTDQIEAKEYLPTAFAVDFSQANPLIPEPNRVAIFIKEFRTVKRTALSFRGDEVCLLTIGDNQKISDIHFYYDSYVPSQAYANDTPQIINPDIDPVLDPLRVTSTDPMAALTAAINFFTRFSQVNVVGNFNLLLGDPTTSPPLPPVITQDAIVSFAGDPRYLPFADTKIRQGADQVVFTFTQQLDNSLPRTFDLQEFFVGSASNGDGDRVVANAHELRFSAHTNRGYDVQVEIAMTAKNGLVGSVQGIFDSVITTTAFTGSDPFDCKGIDNGACLEPTKLAP